MAIVEFAFNYPSITQETGAIASQLITHNLVILARGEDNWIRKLQGASRGNEDASVLEILSDAFQLATLKGKRKGKICCICSNLTYVSQVRCGIADTAFNVMFTKHNHMQKALKAI